MVSSIVTHVIGTAALMVVLAMVISFTSSTTSYVIYNNERRVLVSIAESIALQLKYAINSRSDTNVTLDYPLWVVGQQPYMILVGSGLALKNKYDFLWSQNLSSDAIYVIVVSIDYRVYGCKIVCNQSFSNYFIVVEDDPARFSSTRLVQLRQRVIGDTIILEFVVIGDKTP